MLKERERVLTEAESAVAAAKAGLDMTIQLEVKRRVMANEEVNTFACVNLFITVNSGAYYPYIAYNPRPDLGRTL